MSEQVTNSYFELLQVHRSIIWKGVCCWEKNSPFSASAEALMSSKTTESIWNVWCQWGSFLGEAEETLLRSVYTSACPIPTAVFWNFEQIISRMSLKIKFVLIFFACWRHPLLWRENCRNSAFPVFNIRVQLPFLRWNYSQGTFATVLYEEKDILFFPALRTWKKKVCWIKNGEGKKIRIGCLKKKIQVGSTDLTRNGN